ncbi:hypothetical protein LPJ73_001956 [Coemansia sp. RSA 2703]|nr:hypothetical protein LPJ73_001956 [Coemansia sp. RSA 2703]KAJ2373249.1 hypothetical protein IW150_003717 [Coemansia sp. RSA 2607]KAJ2396803.1 hypothetical protein GGI05_000958 [Coemansia sp. RSA 2603]
MTCTTFRSGFDDVDVPATDLPTFFLGGLRAQAQFARSDSPRPVFIDGSAEGESLTLAQFEQLTRMLASGLHHHVGVRTGDVVLVVLPNSARYLAVTTAVLMAGGVCSPANPAYTAAELAHQLKHAHCRFVVTATATLATVRQALVGYPAVPLHHVLCIDSKTVDGVRSVTNVLCTQPFPQMRLHDHATMKRTAAFICYSGGTTGLPKGVVLSHYNVVANIQQGRHVQAMMHCGERQRTTLAVLPMFHSFGLVLTAHSLPLCGATLVVMAKFDLHGFLRLVEQHSVTDTLLVPPIINALAKTPGLAQKYNLSSLRWIVSGAAPLSAHTAMALEQRLPHVRVMQGYGLTETSPGLALNTPALCDARSSGPLLPSVEARVLDMHGRSVGPNETGELCFRGPNIMLGYLDDPEETARCIDAEGFFHTGDVGFIDDRGLVHVTDRIKELIKFNGFQVAPAELEGILMQHGLVKDCAVVGVFDEERQTELPRAYIVLSSAEDGEQAAQHVREWVDAQVAYYKRLRGGCFAIEAIPKTASGKILRRELRGIVV